MSTQFRKYMSIDSGSPILNGTSGSLISVLDACLVNGYGTGANFHSSSGWLKPIANSGSYGCWQQPSGSGHALYIHDGSPGTAAGVKEAWATGWETINDLTQPVGSGSNPFPSGSQLYTPAHVIVKKTATIDATDREWVMFADDRTFYLFINHYEASYLNAYTGLWFGDIYSLYPNDISKCMIVARYTENSTNITGDGQSSIYPYKQTGVYGAFISRPWHQYGTSSVINRSGWYAYQPGYPMLGGAMSTPNINGGLYIQPYQIFEQNGGLVPYRGWFRGMYQIGHYPTNFSNGQIVVGANEYAGKEFEIVKRGMQGGMWAIEITPTVETS